MQTTQYEPTPKDLDEVACRHLTVDFYYNLQKLSQFFFNNPEDFKLFEENITVLKYRMSKLDKVNY